jgi:hypothetical protein
MVVRDSTFLNATSFRQMSGRAGRRGFDNLGHCVFLGISYARLKNVLTSAVPLIRGGFPINSSLVLRLQMLATYNRKRAAECGSDGRVIEVAQRIHQILRQPLLTNEMVGGATSTSYLLHYYDFALDLLRDLGVMNERNEVIWLGAIAVSLPFVSLHCSLTDAA